MLLQHRRCSSCRAVRAEQKTQIVACIASAAHLLVQCICCYGQRACRVQKLTGNYLLQAVQGILLQGVGKVCTVAQLLQHSLCIAELAPVCLAIVELGLQGLHI